MDLWSGYSVRVADTAHAGRQLLATAPIPAGSLVLQSACAGHTAHRSDLPFICAHCFSYSVSRDEPLEVECSGGCYTHYSGFLVLAQMLHGSKMCLLAAAASHGPVCKALRSVARDKALKREEAALARLLFSMLGRCSAAAAAGEAAAAAEEAAASVEVAGAAADATDSVLVPSAGAAETDANITGRDSLGSSKVPQCSVAAVQTMMVDDGSVKRLTKRKRERETAAKAFVKLLPPQPPPGTAAAAPQDGESITRTLQEQLALCPQFRSASEAAALLSRGTLNGFGLWTMDGDGGCGFGLFPAAAMFNHSCAPNVSGQLERDVMTFYATDDLEAGDVLSWSYITLHHPKQANGADFTRHQVLQLSWGFGCACIRCKLDQAPYAEISPSAEVADRHAAYLKRAEKMLKAFDTAHVCKTCGLVKVPPHRQHNPARRRPATNAAAAAAAAAAHETLEAAGAECFCNTFNRLQVKDEE